MGHSGKFAIHPPKFFLSYRKKFIAWYLHVTTKPVGEGDSNIKKVGMLVKNFEIDP